MHESSFPTLNHGYTRAFRAGGLSVGLVVPIEAYPHGPVPPLTHHVEVAQLADALGFAALWLRDVPFNVPSFGDAGQIFDPFAYLGFLAAKTEAIALGVASVILPLRHPAHVAKSATSVDVLSGGRLLLGVASGDRPDEYPALGVSFASRGARFRQSFEYIERMADQQPRLESQLGRVGGGMDLLPKPTAEQLPLLITGGSQQDPEWIAGHGAGWMIYPQSPSAQQRTVQTYRDRTLSLGRGIRPVMQPLYVDLVDDDDAPPRPLHLGMRVGVKHLRAHLRALQEIGVNHVALNLRFNTRPINDTLKRLADGLLSDFPAHESIDPHDEMKKP